MADELVEDQLTRLLICNSCIDNSVNTNKFVKSIAEGDMDYGFSYSKREGIKASARIGKAVVSVHIPQEELIKVLK